MKLQSIVSPAESIAEDRRALAQEDASAQVWTVWLRSRPSSFAGCIGPGARKLPVWDGRRRRSGATPVSMQMALIAIHDAQGDLAGTLAASEQRLYRFNPTLDETTHAAEVHTASETSERATPDARSWRAGQRLFQATMARC